MLEILKPGPDGIRFVLAGQECARKIYNALFNLFFPLHVKTKQNAVWPRFDPFFFFLSFSFFYWLPGLYCRKGYCYFLLHLKKKKKQVIGGIILIYAGFLQKKKKTVSVEKNNYIFRFGIPLSPTFFFPPQ